MAFFHLNCKHSNLSVRTKYGDAAQRGFKVPYPLRAIARRLKRHYDRPAQSYPPKPTSGPCQPNPSFIRVARDPPGAGQSHLEPGDACSLLVRRGFITTYSRDA